MKKIKSIIWSIQYKINDIINYLESKQCKRLYPDYKDDAYNIGHLKFIWGIKAYDDLSPGKDANFYTMNDIDITYDRKSKLYMIGIETAYHFKDKEAECRYLERLLKYLDKFMDDNNYSKNQGMCLFMTSPPSLLSSAESIEDLYTNFKIFVEGFCAAHGY